METDLFSWENWDELSDGASQYYNCTLEMNIGEFLAGDTIPIIVLDYESGVLEFFDNNNKSISKHNLKLVLA